MSRASSAAGKDGVRATSATSRTASAVESPRDSMSSEVSSARTFTASAPPSFAAASATWTALFVRGALEQELAGEVGEARLPRRLVDVPQLDHQRDVRLGHRAVRDQRDLEGRRGA